MEEAYPTAEALKMVEEIMSSIDPDLAESESVKIIEGFDVKVTRELIHILRASVFFSP